MKNCPNCGHDVAEGTSFCVNCGVSLVSERDDAVCAVCGEKLEKDVKFCGKCGARVVKPAPTMPERCDVCGAVVPDGAAFCSNCGAKSKSGVEGEPTKRAEKPAKRKSFGEIYGKVKAFESKHCVITNALIAICAIVVIFVSLFCPIKTTQANITVSDTSDASLDSVEIGQSVFKIFGSLGYLGIDMSDADDVKKVEDIVAEYNAASERISDEFGVWLKIQQEKKGAVTREEQQKKLRQLTEKYMGDVNLFAYTFAYTTVGALDHITGADDAEKSLSDTLDTTRTNAIIAVVFALVVAVMQIALAVLSLVFAIFAVLGIVRKRQTRPRTYFIPTVIISGIGLIALALAPMLLSGGAMLAVAVVSSLVWIAYISVRAFVIGKDKQAIIKNVVCAALLTVSFFVLCSPFVKTTVETSAAGVRSSQKGIGSIGAAFESIITYALMLSMDNYAIIYSDVSLANAIVTLALGIAVMTVAFEAFASSLDRLYKNAEKTTRFDVPAFLGALLPTVFAISIAVIGAVDSVPVTTTANNTIGCTMKFAARAHVYCAIAFSLAATVFGIAFKPNVHTNAPVEPEAAEVVSA